MQCLVDADRRYPRGLSLSSPSRQLHSLSASNNYFKLETDNVNGYAGIEFENDAKTWTLGINNSDDFVLASAASFGGGYPITVKNGAYNNQLVLASAGKIGIGTTSPATELHVVGDITGQAISGTSLHVEETTKINGSISKPIESISSTDTLDDTNYTVLVDCSSGNVTINLPAASSSTGKIFIIKKKDSSSNSVIVDPNSTELIDGSSDFTFSSQNRAITIQCDGSAWYIISSYILNY